MEKGRDIYQTLYCILGALYVITIKIPNSSTQSVIILLIFLDGKKQRHRELEMGGVPFWFLQY